MFRRVLSTKFMHLAGAALLAASAAAPAHLLAVTAPPPSKAESSPATQATATSQVTPPNWVPIVKSAKPAVVNISTTRTARVEGMGPAFPFNDPFFRRFFGEEFFRDFGAPPEQLETSLGSGVIIDPSGFILTNSHVVAEAGEVKVVLGDDREYEAKVIGTDPQTDIAVIKIEPDEPLPSIPWGNSKNLQVGEYVLAIGSPFGLLQTVTLGIVSAVGRANVGIADYEDFIQTDAAINPGNSGGALVNANGELVGINTAIFSRTGGYMGIGFAVPSNMARTVTASLIEQGRVVRGWLGIGIQEVTPEIAQEFDLQDARGVVVTDVSDGSPAAEAGLKRGDVIVQYRGEPVDDPGQLRNMVAATQVGEKVPLAIVRDGKPGKETVTVGELQMQEPVAAAGAQPQPAQGTALAGVDVQKITPSIAEQLGISGNTSGVVITDVAPDSPAAAAGLQPGDIIKEINRSEIDDEADYQRSVTQLDADQRVLALVERQGGGSAFVVIKPTG